MEFELEDTCYIYIITNLRSHKQYVGSTVDLERRIKQHRSKHSCCPALRNAVKKYGWESFEVQVVEICQLPQRVERETYWIGKQKSVQPDGYNLALTGSGVAGYKWSEDARRAQSERCKGRTVSNETRQKISVGLRGRKRKPESVAASAAAHIGRPKSEETKAKISSSRKGKRGPTAKVMIQGEIFETMTEAAKTLGVSIAYISKCIKERREGFVLLKHSHKTRNYENVEQRDF